MVLNYIPAAKVTANDIDITEKLALTSFVLTVDDNIGYENDRLTMTILDVNRNIKLLDKDTKLKVVLGYKSNFNSEFVQSRLMGEFELSEYSINVSRDGGRVLNFVGSAISHGVKGLASTNTRNWVDVTFGQVVRTIANEYELGVEIQSDLVSKEIAYENQDGPDQEFISYLAKRYDAYVKVFNGTIYIYQRGKFQEEAGSDNVVNLYGADGNNDNVIIDANYQKKYKESYTGVEVRYKSGEEIQTVSVGNVSDNESVLKLPLVYDNAALASQIATAKIKQLGRLNEQLTMTVIGNPNLQSGKVIEVQEFDKDINGQYYIDSVVHNFDNGYTCKLVCTLVTA